MKVLIVEDVDTMRELLKLVLDGAIAVTGQTVIQVTGAVRNGPEARQEVLRHRPDLVLLDEVLPGESSADLVVDLFNQKIPVILITGMEGARHPMPRQALGRIFKPRWTEMDTDRTRIVREILQLTATRKTVN